LRNEGKTKLNPVAHNTRCLN